MLTLAAVASAGAISPDSLDFLPVAVLPFRPELAIPYGDADHDGRPELYLQSGWGAVFALEHTGGNHFDSIPLNLQPRASLTWTLGDPDVDGRCDLMTQTGGVSFGQAVHLFESRDSWHLPDSLVWADTVVEMAGIMWSRFTDLDADSVQELAVRDETDGCIRIYENREDNGYELVARLENVYPPSLDQLMLQQTYDLDRDGRPEMATGSANAWLTFYEAVANDSFVPVAMCSLNRVYSQCCGLDAWPDIDGDGRPELVAFFAGIDNNGLLQVYESPADDSFEVTWELPVLANYWGHLFLSIGDIDEDSVPELLVFDGYSTTMYRCTGNDQYEPAWYSQDYYGPFAIYDVNSDGRNELICRSGLHETTILRWCEVGIAECEAAQLRGVEVLPSVLRAGAGLNLTGLPPDARVELLDVTGRVRVCPDLTLGIGDLSLRPGAYFVRITSGSQSVTRKVLVVE